MNNQKTFPSNGIVIENKTKFKQRLLHWGGTILANSLDALRSFAINHFSELACSSVKQASWAR